MLDQNWGKTDASRDGMAAFSSTWTSVGQLFDLRDPAAARARGLRELDSSRHSQAPFRKGALLDELGRVAAIAGDLAAARSARDEVGDSRYAAPYVAFYEGRLDEAATLWETLRASEQQSGNRRDQLASTRDSVWSGGYRAGGRTPNASSSTRSPSPSTGRSASSRSRREPSWPYAGREMAGPPKPGVTLTGRSS